MGTKRSGVRVRLGDTVGECFDQAGRGVKIQCSPAGSHTNRVWLWKASTGHVSCGDVVFASYLMGSS